MAGLCGPSARFAAATLSKNRGVGVGRTPELAIFPLIRKYSCNVRALFQEMKAQALNMSRPSDTEELLVQVEQGDERARSRLLERHRDQLRRMVAVRLDRRLLPRLDPSDIIQEALAEADGKLGDYLRERPIRFYPWLRRLAWEHLVRLQQRHLRTARRSVAREKLSLTGLPDESALDLAQRLADSGFAPDRRVLETELKDRVREALEQLPERDREVLVLRYLEDLSTKDIAAVMGISEGAARVCTTRALDRIAKFVGREQ